MCKMPTLLCWLEGYSVGQYIIKPTLQLHHYQNSSQQSRIFHSKFSHGWEPRLEGSGKQHQCLKDDFQTFQYFTLHSRLLVLCHTGACRLICVQSWDRGARKITQPVLARLFQRKLWLLPALQKSSQLAQQTSTFIWGVIQKYDVKFVRTGEIVFSQFGQSFKTSWTSWKSWTCCLLLFSTKTRAMTLSSPHDSFFSLLAKIGRFRLWPYLPGFKSTGRHWRAAPLLDTLAQWSSPSSKGVGTTCARRMSRKFER